MMHSVFYFLGDYSMSILRLVTQHTSRHILAFDRSGITH